MDFCDPDSQANGDSFVDLTSERNVASEFSAFLLGQSDKDSQVSLCSTKM